MDKQTHKFITMTGLGLLALGIGACKQQPPEDNTPPPMPVSRKPAAPAPGGDGNAMTPGGSKKPGAGAMAKGQPKSGSKMGGPQTAGKKGAPGTPAMARSGGDPFAPGGMQRPAPGAAAAPGSPGAAPQTPKIMVYSGRRQDPFFVSWTLPVPPPNVFDEVEPIRLASDAVETPPTKPFEVREQPELRVSGIMTGDGVFAILESGGDKVDVVKPGSSVDIAVEGQTKRTYKVVSITKDKVKLRSQVGNVIYTQEVPLSDVAVGTPPRGGFGGPGGMPGPAGSAGFGPGASFGPGGASFGPGGASFGPGGSSGPGGGSFGPGGGRGRRGR